MNNYKDYILSKGGKELGILFSDIEQHILTPKQYEDFSDFIMGQTCGIVGGLSVCYVCDFERFINGDWRNR